MTQKEYRRVLERRPQQPFDAKRYEANLKNINKSDIESLKKFKKQCEIQHEYQTNRAINLELALKYGKQAWLVHNEQSSTVLTECKKHLESLQDDVRQVNLKRMEEQ
eukprot:Awhi_evm1s3386